ncbi:MAG: class I SAM-dependent methyltransferase [Nitrospirae bacterium]|nr:class I SAM-dependent methyltransferase [Nitrospirota bacterium]MBI4839351.1 class I SAM-dependent methyltransferase [Nitrospirota bacterium]
MFKKIIKKTIFHPSISKKIAVFLLKLMNKAYYLLGIFAAAAEKGVHPKHRLTDYHRFFLDNINSEDHVLDAGCGHGLVARDVALKAREVICIDLNEKHIEGAKRNCRDIPAGKIKFIHGDATAYDFKHSFDKIILSNVLEHIEDRIGFLIKIKKLAPVFLLRVPMINRDWMTLYKKELGLEYRLDRSHFIEYTLESFKDELAKAGLEIESYSIQFGEIWAKAKSQS